MNIFYLNADPVKAAILQCDKHVVKMTLETTQILSTVMHYYRNADAPYKETHRNHPCVVWARESKANYEWLIEHFKGLLSEYTYRYNKQHACGKHLATFCNFVENNKFNKTDFMLMHQCMPEEFRQEDSVKAYQAYYKSKPEWIMKYTNRSIPKFMEE